MAVDCGYQSQSRVPGDPTSATNSPRRCSARGDLAGGTRRLPDPSSAAAQMPLNEQGSKPCSRCAIQRPFGYQGSKVGSSIARPGPRSAVASRPARKGRHSRQLWSRRLRRRRANVPAEPRGPIDRAPTGGQRPRRWRTQGPPLCDSDRDPAKLPATSPPA